MNFKMNSKILDFRDGKKSIEPITKRGEAMGVCATFNRRYVCCNVHVLRSVHNCPFECSYCFLQNYLTDGATKSVQNINELMDEVKGKISREPDRLFRIGTWELGDSLALEKETGQARKLIQGFASFRNAVLELKTKSDCVEPILDVRHRSRTVISWSLNPDHIIYTEELGTALLGKRLKAMNRVQEAGYLIGLHFDPMILYDGWQRDYENLVNKVFATVSSERVAWISMGSLRFNPEMKKKIENNYPDSRLTCDEMVLGDDSKVRYVKPLRIGMYRHLNNVLNRYINKDNLVYLCMERWDMWDRVFGYHRSSADYLDYLFAKSLFERFGIGPGIPQLEDYKLKGE
jgi:spore photoproduct lyase